MLVVVLVVGVGLGMVRVGRGSGSLTGLPAPSIHHQIKFGLGPTYGTSRSEGQVVVVMGKMVIMAPGADVENFSGIHGLGLSELGGNGDSVIGGSPGSAVDTVLLSTLKIESK